MKLCLSIAHGILKDKKNSFKSNSLTPNFFYNRISFTIFLTMLFFFVPIYAVRSSKNSSTGTRKKHYSYLLPYEEEKTLTTSNLKNSTQRALIKLFETAPEDFKQINAIKLLNAIDLFHGVPGFFCTLKKVVNQARQDALAHGYLYEIETALLLEEQGEKVCCFGREHHAQRPLHNREIDIETRHYHIECKDIFWENHPLRSNPDKLKCQLSEQRALIEEENGWINKRNRPKKFLLYSKQPIPQEWQQWLKQQRIDYHCTSDEENLSNSLSTSSSTSEDNNWEELIIANNR